MRVSTSQIFDAGVLGIQRNQADLFKTQNQLSTGRRILTPADDPIAASQALVLGQSKTVNSQYMDNQAIAKSHLGLVETNLTSVANELQNILEKAVQAGNGTLDAKERGMIAQDMKGSLDDILSLANAQDGDGGYIFAGFKSQTKPFGLTGNTAPFSLGAGTQYVAYNGDDGQQKLQVSASLDMSINETGADAFMQVRDGQGNVTGRSMFDSIKNMVDILDPSSGVPFTQAAYDQAVNDLHAGIDNIARIRASVGSRQAALESLTSLGQDVNLQYESRISDLQDIDYAQAISDLTQQQTQLQAAQKSFAQTNQLSLFNYL